MKVHQLIHGSMETDDSAILHSCKYDGHTEDESGLYKCERSYCFAVRRLSYDKIKENK